MTDPASLSKPSVSSDASATFCATLVDEWVRAECAAAFVAPGSRSTPLALALIRRSAELPVHLFHDERSASFAALGHAAATDKATILLCTSGTAAAHFYAAIIEADLSSIPLIVCTADRPPELIGVGAPQTIDQVRMYGQSVRYACEPGVPEWTNASSWRSTGSRLVLEALGASGRPGPVHANIGFRDPLDASPSDLPTGRDAHLPWHQNLRTSTGTSGPSSSQVDRVLNLIEGRRGVIVAGRSTTDPDRILDLSERLGWPVFADHRSQCRAPGRAIAHFDSLLRVETMAAPFPEVVLRLGEAPASKVLAQWLAAAADSGATTIAAQSQSRWIDPDRRADLTVEIQGLASALLDRLESITSVNESVTAEGARWLRADRAAAAAIERWLADGNEATEPAVARAALSDVPTGGALVVSSSMPIRDVEWFGPNRNDIDVFSNRGANGIDGVIATGIGVASTGRPTTVLIGDVAFLHDSSSLVALAMRNLPLSVVVIDNDGGGIFSFLPQARSVEPPAFELLYGTPHGTDLVALAQAHGLEAESWQPGHSTAPTHRPRIIVARTGARSANVEVHGSLNAAIAEAIRASEAF